MPVIDLRPELEPLYFQCLEDWSEEMRESGDHKRHWYALNKDRGLRVKLAVDENGVVGGMIQYLPIEHSNAVGKGLYFVYCTWVHGYTQGRGNFQKRGIGTELLRAAEEDARSLGAAGLAAWGIVLPFFMRAAWYRRRGYVKADRDGLAELLWKRFRADAEPPRWIKRKKVPARIPGRVTVSAFINGWCPAQGIAFERARRAAADLGDRVVFQEYHTADRAVFEEWGISDGLYVDGKPVAAGPPPSYQRLRSIIAKRLRKLRPAAVTQASR